LGEEFLTCVEGCIERIGRAPDSYAFAYQAYRRALVRRFPFAVFYEHDTGRVTIFAILHTARDPRKWLRRLSD
jgi:plasmid stabilization system protein ParE